VVLKLIHVHVEFAECMGLDESLKAFADGGKGRNSNGTRAQVFPAGAFEGIPQSSAAAFYEISHDHVEDLFRKPIHGCRRKAMVLFGNREGVGANPAGLGY
jgi:hypothetical protein